MLFIILVLLMIQLRHFGKAMLVLATGPLGIIGAAAALLVSGAPFGFVAILGVIALLGIIMRNSSSCSTRSTRTWPRGHDPVEAVVGSAVRRFRPIMLTATAAMLALIPIARSIFWGPLAYAMMGGIAGRDRADDPRAAGGLRLLLQVGPSPRDDAGGVAARQCRARRRQLTCTRGFPRCHWSCAAALQAWNRLASARPV